MANIGLVTVIPVTVGSSDQDRPPRPDRVVVAGAEEPRGVGRQPDDVSAGGKAGGDGEEEKEERGGGGKADHGGAAGGPGMLLAITSSR